MRPVTRLTNIACLPVALAFVLLGELTAVAADAKHQVAHSDSRPTVTREIRYQMRDAGEVWLVWGVNGWHAVPEDIRPPRTVIGRNDLMNTPMEFRGDAFTAKITVPVGTSLDYCFLVTRKRNEFDITWPLCDGNYNEMAQRTGYTDIDSQLSLTVVRQEVRYSIPDATEVFLVWGLNGWAIVPESLRPKGTMIMNNLMVSPMTRKDSGFVAFLDVPRGSRINFGFRITKSGKGIPVSLWEGGGKDGFQEIARDDRIIEIKGSVNILMTGRRNRGEPERWGPLLVLVSGVSGPLLLSWMILAVRQRIRRRRLANPFFSRRRIPSRAVDVVVILVALVLATACGEGLLANTYPNSGFGTAVEMEWFRKGAYRSTQLFTTDTALGFRPWLRTGPYNEYGTLQNSYNFEKQRDRTRVLFLGNTATYDGAVIQAMKNLHGEENFEYWNAGVPAFNTIQQIQFYKLHNARLNPDHVVMMIQPDDVETTPLAFRSRGTELTVYLPNIPRAEIDPWLFEKSYVYRFVRSFSISDGDGQHRIMEEYRARLAEFRDTLAREHIRLSVILLPLLAPMELWSQDEIKRTNEMLAILNELRLDHYDLREAMSETAPLDAKLHDTTAQPWTPTPEIAQTFARYLTKRGLFLVKTNTT